MPASRDRLELGAITAFGLLWIALAARVALRSESHAPLAPMLLTAGVGGLVIADLISGLVHFTCDRFFSERTPLIGALFIEPFRSHHDDPLGITRHGFCARNGNNCLALLPVLALLHTTLGTLQSDALRSGGATFCLTLTAAMAATNQVHGWAHTANPPRFVRALQRARVILSPAAHGRHHRGAHASAYCITTGWLNPLLDACDAFGAIERVVRAATRNVAALHPRLPRSVTRGRNARRP